MSSRGARIVAAFVASMPRSSSLSLSLSMALFTSTATSSSSPSSSSFSRSSAAALGTRKKPSVLWRILRGDRRGRALFFSSLDWERERRKVSFDSCHCRQAPFEHNSLFLSRARLSLNSSFSHATSRSRDSPARRHPSAQAEGTKEQAHTRTHALFHDMDDDPSTLQQQQRQQQQQQQMQQNRGPSPGKGCYEVRLCSERAKRFDSRCGARGRQREDDARRRC